VRVAIEATSLTLTSGGLARYTWELSTALARTFPDDQFFLISDQEFEMPAQAPENLRRGGSPRNAFERRWWLWGIMHEAGRLGADVVHGPDFAVPYLPQRPSVMTVHDLSPWMDHRWHGGADRVRRRTPVLLELGLATMVITPSEHVRKEAIERFGLPPARVVAIPEAAPSWMRPVEAAPPAVPYFLFVGTLEPRKNLEALVGAWREVRRDHQVDLVIAGRRRSDFAALPDEPGLRVLGEVADSDLPALYSGALAFVYPSFYEGFGLPVLEAMQCGAPVIASQAVEEWAGDAAIYGKLEPALRLAVERPEVLREFRARGLERSDMYSWDRTARQTYEVYEEAQRRFGG